ncbi:MAG: CDGSH iron-sulfur domain-containing protein [Bacteroidales bacterium]|nr:CDGSH iron-sulfur domain-containing protein [Bacteroidales bacterium]MCF8350877.1 CDGSH iron-sulfur domain-containing protein [Bacteroidales bacterium]MCF8375641.1 CDGSH iron-sulfur domain-containing protein [Bacteroidales bacterium]MCF8400776.1 CDGSH iron-sulfur domain-containing protein [Bacteroidales bacterium]
MKKPEISGKMPRMLEMEPGDYYWCACGKSKNQPFCDGSHQGSEFTPLHTRINEKKNVYWCMCKSSANKPFCDGTHKDL